MTPNDASSQLVALARSMIRHGRAEDASALLAAAAELEPGRAEIALLQSQASFRAGSFTAAGQHVARGMARATARERTILTYLQAFILLAQGRRGEAQAVYRQGEALPRTTAATSERH